MTKLSKVIIRAFLGLALGFFLPPDGFVKSNSTSAGLASASAAQIVPPLTAKVELSNAINLARKWQPDASLVNILGPSVDARGVSLPSSPYSWSYTFDSKKAGKAFMVSVGNVADAATLSKIMTDGSYLFYVGKDAGLTGSQQGPGAIGPGCQALPADFLDSDKAIAAAKAAGYQLTSQIQMHLAKCHSATALWEVNAFKIDATTGKHVQ